MQGPTPWSNTCLSESLVPNESPLECAARGGDRLLML